jgi:hypothetical protein
VRSDGWYQGDDGPANTFGFQAYHASGSGAAGAIRFYDCRANLNLYGLWINGDAGRPLNRCVVVGGLFQGARKDSGQASGGSATSLIHAGKHFPAYGVEVGDYVVNDTDESWGQVTALESSGDPLVLDTLILSGGWQEGDTNTCEQDDEYSVPVLGSRGIKIQNGKGTLVLGSTFGRVMRGVEINASNGDDYQTHLTQVIGAKMDNVPGAGVYVGQDAQMTQVVAVARANENKVLQDQGTRTLLLAHQAVDLPADTYVTGLLDARVKEDPPAGALTRYASGLGYSNGLLDEAFGRDLADGFVGVYYDSLNLRFYVVTRANSGWKGVVLTS